MQQPTTARRSVLISPLGWAGASGRLGQWQTQLEPCTPSLWWVGDLKLAAVGVGQPPGDVQPKPKATTGASGGLAQPRIPLEDPVAIGHRDPRPLILYGHHDVHAIPGRRQPDRRPLQGVGGGVVEQVAEDPAERKRVDPHQQRPSNLDGDRMVWVRQPGGAASLLSQRGGVDQRASRQGGMAAVQAGGG